MTFRSTAIAVLAAAAVSAPLAAHAATYEPLTAGDPAYDATDAPKEPTNAGIDVTKVRATRTDSTFAIAVTYRNLERASYSRRLVGLQNGNSRSRVLEYRTAGPGSTPKVTLYKADSKEQTISPVACDGVRTVTNQAEDRLTFVIPVACYPGAVEDGAQLSVATYKWSADTWTPGPFTVSQKEPNQADFVGDGWTWTGTQVERPAPSTRLF